jgi:hypothetical protein
LHKEYGSRVYGNLTFNCMVRHPLKRNHRTNARERKGPGDFVRVDFVQTNIEGSLST